MGSSIVLCQIDTLCCQQKKNWKTKEDKGVYVLRLVKRHEAALSSVTLICMVNFSPPAGATYQWDTTGCFTNDRHPTPACFPTDQTTQNVTDDDITAEDAGTITCTVTIGGIDYTSEPFTLRISGTVYLHK